jgi:hypothetical protein
MHFEPSCNVAKVKSRARAKNEPIKSLRYFPILDEASFV